MNRAASLMWAGALILLALGCGPQGEAPLNPAPQASAQPSEDETTGAYLELLKVNAKHANRDRYLNLMKLSLTDLLYENDPVGRAKRIVGEDWPSRAYTMIGVQRLNNIQECSERVFENGIEGDFIEAGAWRGGATIFMRAVLEAYGVTDRVVWVADSFEGLPPPDVENYPADEGLDLSEVDVLAVSQEEVERNFRRYGLLDDQVKFLKGWFKDSLPDAPIEHLAMLRLDADLYESTIQALEYLYPKVSPGGCVIVDDFLIPACRKAIYHFHEQQGIELKLLRIDDSSVYWIKE